VRDALRRQLALEAFEQLRRVASDDSTPLSIRDESDVAVVRSAIAAGVDMLITGDRDLLEAQLPIRVPSPRAFWELLRGQPPTGEAHEG
jgi:predicted nucleic acid-binding protein